MANKRRPFDYFGVMYQLTVGLAGEILEERKFKPMIKKLREHERMHAKMQGKSAPTFNEVTDRKMIKLLKKHGLIKEK